MKNSFKRWIRNYFGFSHREMNGFLVVIFLMVALIAGRIAYHFYLVQQPFPQVFSAEDQEKMAEWLEQQPEQVAVKEGKETENLSNKWTYEVFDPNQASAQKMQEMMPQWLAQRIVKYRERVRYFENKAQLRKIYGLNEATLQRIAPYVKIDKSYLSEVQTEKETSAGVNDTISKKWQAKPKAPEPPKWKNLRVNVNTVDSINLQVFPGIGPGFAHRIITYREMLGGFVNKNQLSEVYGLPDSTVALLKDHVFVAKTPGLHKIPINTDSIKVLAHHPYISWNMARLMVHYKQQHGRYERPADLLALVLVDSATLLRLKPYLDFSERQ